LKLFYFVRIIRNYTVMYRYSTWHCGFKRSG